MTYPNGVVTTYDYDRESRLLDVTAAKAPYIIAKHTYTYDVIGNRLTKITPDYSETYGYDVADQLVSAMRTGAGANNWHWTYDPSGNRTTEQLGEAAMGATHNNMNQLLSRQPGGALQFKGTVSEPATVAIQGKPAQVDASNIFTGAAQVPLGTSTVDVQAIDASGNVRTNTYQVSTTGETASYSYDSNGNLIQKTENGHVWGYEWNAENQLIRVTKDAAEVATFKYDPVGRRVEKAAGGVTTSYLYGIGDILHELRSATSVTYVRGPGIDEPLARIDQTGVVNYYHADGLDSIVQMTDAGGVVTTSYDYNAWGKLMPSSATPEPYSYSGREWDPEIQAYYYRARWYDSEYGRFTNEDPIGFEGGVNFYAYVQNNPTAWIDPLGLFCTQDFVRHYYFGGGTTIHLSSVGLLHGFRTSASVQGSVKRFKQRLESLALARAKSLCKKCNTGTKTGFVGLSGRDTTDVTNEPCLFAVGHSTLFQKATCGVTANCKSKTYSFSCALSFSIRDWFKDPLGLGIETGGTPCRINADWSDSVCGSGTF